MQYISIPVNWSGDWSECTLNSHDEENRADLTGTFELITLFQTAEPERSKIPLILGYSLSIGCLIWVLHDFHIVQAMKELSNVNWKWVLIGMGFDVLSYGMQALRWKFLLTPFKKVPLTHAIRAVYAGLFANLVFPLRPGELLRCYLISDSEDISIGRVLGSVGVERLIDLVIATASLAIVSLLVPLPRRFERVADTLGVVTLVLLAIIVLMIFYLEVKLGKDPTLGTGPHRLPGKMMRALLGLHAMGTAPSFYAAVLASVFMPLCQVMGLWAMMKGYHLTLPFLAAIVVLLIINLGVSLPNAPANIGAYQFFCVLGLSVFNVEKTTATGFSFFAFLALTIPFIFLGFAALLRSGLSLKSMRETVTHLPSGARSSAQCPS
ncbi:MAG: lysylphosphatidylglycerol synthase transmembrane domain-containing protein [Candidatus Acidiferrales bacterium]